MISKKKLLPGSRLYLLLDKDSTPLGDAVSVVRLLKKGPVDLLQLRENTACDKDFLNDAEIIGRLCKERGIIYLVNNRLDIAQLVDADGLHLGQFDLPLEAARKALGRDKIIGITCRNLNQALKAQAEGADYISIGPVFFTRTKPHLKPISPIIIRKLRQVIKIPVFAIGGINRSNIKELIAYGADKVCVCRAICRARDVSKAATELRNYL